MLDRKIQLRVGTPQLVQAALKRQDGAANRLAVFLKDVQCVVGRLGERPGLAEVPEDFIQVGLFGLLLVLIGAGRLTSHSLPGGSGFRGGRRRAGGRGGRTGTAGTAGWPPPASRMTGSHCATSQGLGGGQASGGVLAPSDAALSSVDLSEVSQMLPRVDGTATPVACSVHTMGSSTKTKSVPTKKRRGFREAGGQRVLAT